jgi:PAS domain S-box-containing protein
MTVRFPFSLWPWDARHGKSGSWPHAAMLPSTLFAEDGSEPKGDTFAPDCALPSCQVEVLDRIRHAKREWESTVDSLPHLIMLLDGEGRITRCNRTVETWGLGRVAALIGQRMHDLLHPRCTDPRCYIEQFWQGACQDIASGSVASLEAEDAVLKRYIRVEVRSHLASADEPNPALPGFAVAIVEDLTELRRAEEALRCLNDELDLHVRLRTAELMDTNRSLQREIEERRRAEYRLLVETMNEGLAVQDASGVITYVNERLAEFLGCTRRELIGHRTLEFVDPESVEKWQEQIAQRMRGERTPYELAFRGKQNERVFARVSPSPILKQDGSYGGSFAVLSDITDRVRVESELRLLSEQLLTAQEQERKRIASELHDGIGQALSAMKFSVENALHLFTEGASQQGIETLTALVPRVREAIDEVRRIAMNLRPSTLDDLGILATMGWFCREFQAVYRDIRIEKQIDIREEDIPQPLKTAMFRILQEAMNNLAEHGRADVARIVLRKTDNRIELTVEDNGQGFNVEAAGLREGSCRGAGLVSMRERAEFSGGSFSLRSRPGAGTRVHVAWACCDDGCGSELDRDAQRTS